MVTQVKLDDQKLFDKIKVISNKLRFRIIELTKENEMSITELAKELGLSYSKCGDYVAMLEKVDLVKKRKEGKEVYISASSTLSL